MNKTASDHLETLAIHGGRIASESHGALLTPIVQSATFVWPELGRHSGFEYTRTGNPTTAALESALGAVESALPAVAYGSGMGALTGLVLATLKYGDHVICTDVVFGGTVRLFREVFRNIGIEVDFVDTSKTETVAAAWTPKTRMLLVETPGNPTLRLADIAALAELIRGRGALFVVDNTFMTPGLQRPLDLGADVTWYSTTKYLEGHNSTVGGALVTRDPDLLERLRFVQSSAGLGQAPFDGWLTTRGLATLPHRLRIHCDSATQIAAFLADHPHVASVIHPSLATYPQRELSARQMTGPGGMVTFSLRGGLAAATTFAQRIRVASLAASLGGVESLVTHPATMTHRMLSGDERAKLGIDDGMIRYSVGLEHPTDLIGDLEQALA